MVDQCYVMFLCQMVAAWYDDRNTGVTKLFSYTSCQLNLLDLYNSVLLLCTLIISFEIRLGMQGILSVPIIVHVFGQKDGEYDLVYDIKKDGYKAAHVYENILHAYIL